MSDVVPPQSNASDVFEEVVQRLGRMASRAQARALLDEQMAPSSAPAIVAAAARLGITATIGNIPTDSRSLEGYREGGGEMTILFTSRRDFGILERVQRGHYRVWDRLLGSRTFTEEEIQSFWSGTVLLFEAGAEARSQVSWWRRFRRALNDHLDPRRLRLVGGHALLGIPVLLLTLVALSFAAHASEPRDLVSAPSLLLVLLAAATVVDFLLVNIHAGTRAALQFCGSDVNSGCSHLLISPAAYFARVPWAYIGFSVHTALLLVFAVHGPAARWLVAAALAPAVLLALYLGSVQLRQRKYCRLCNTVHSINLVAVALACWDGVVLPTTGTALAHGTAFALFAAAVFFVAVPLIADAEPASRTAGEREHMKRSPWTLLGMLADAPMVERVPVGVVLAEGPAAAPRITVGISLACGFCRDVGRALSAELAFIGDHFRVEVFVVPKMPTKREASLALMSVGLEAGGPAMLRLFRDAPDGQESADPFAAYAAILGVAADDLRQHRERADQMIRAARTEVTDIAQGTPWAVLGARLLVGERLTSFFGKFGNLLEKAKDLVTDILRADEQRLARAATAASPDALVVPPRNPPPPTTPLPPS